MAGEPKTDDALIDAIELRLTSLESGAPASSDDDGTWSAEAIDAECARLRSLLAEVKLHARLADGTVADGEPSTCRECGEARFCPFIRDIATEFGIPITSP